MASQSGRESGENKTREGSTSESKKKREELETEVKKKTRGGISKKKKKREELQKKVKKSRSLPDSIRQGVEDSASLLGAKHDARDGLRLRRRADDHGAASSGGDTSGSQLCDHAACAPLRL